MTDAPPSQISATVATTVSTFLGQLACPRGCAGGALEVDDDVLRCRACGRRYPLIGRIPCLVDDPPFWRALALARLDEYLAANDARRRALTAEAALPDLLPRTRQRLGRVIAALAVDRQMLPKIFSDLQRGAILVPPSMIPVRAEQPAGELPLLKCYENVFRDWVWGEKENRIACALVERLAPGPLGRLAIYGAGAGRLAVDVHRALRPAQTFAFDNNPLPLLIADVLVGGGALELYEYPVAPNSDDDAVVRQRVACPVPVEEGFTFLFADALNPPFAPGSLDTVLTSWFIDAVAADLRQTAAAINRALAPGGVWLNVGPLRFDQALSRIYTIEEARELVAASGFELLSDLREEIPYFNSPHSGSRRMERVFGFAARKIGPAATADVSSLTAPWVADPDLPIPATPELAALGRTSAFTAGVLSMIDGRRSTNDLARELGKSWGIDPGAVREQLRAFLARLR